MNDLNEIKEQLTNLVISGKKEEAIKLLQQKYGTNRDEAEKLLGLAIKESITPVKFFSTVLKGAPERMGAGKGCKSILFKFIAVLFGFFGIPMILISIGFYAYIDYRINNSETVKGIVTEIRIHEYYGEQPSYTPVIEYVFDGAKMTMDAPVYFDSPEFEVGEEVNLFVSVENPRDVIIDTFAQKWFVITVVGSIGIFCVLCMVLFLILARHSSKRK